MRESLTHHGLPRENSTRQSLMGVASVSSHHIRVCETGLLQSGSLCYAAPLANGYSVRR